MEITIIHGQSHKGSTYHISQMLKERLTDSESNVNEFFLPVDGPAFCAGCYQCIMKGESNCPHSDKVQKIAEAMIRSRVIIIDSPTYCLDMSGQLKTLFDHLGYMWFSHRPRKEMFTKIGIALSTTAGAGAKRVTKSIAKQMFWWGVPKVFKMPFTVSAMRWSEVTEKTRKIISESVEQVADSIKRCEGKAAPGIGSRFLFGLMRKMHAGNTWNPTDRDYWKNNGWTLDVRPWRA
jgi:multimeric flavodoxin WrbA